MSKYCCFVKSTDEEIFYETKNFYAVYNLKPVVPGHSLVIPKKHTASLHDLKSSEVAEMFELCRKVLRAFQKVYKTKQFDLSIQEGRTAGQVVQHLHAHLIPRKPGDLDKPWYKLVETSEQRLPAPLEERVEQARLLRAAMSE